jgi:hypothetical protein
MSSTAEREIRYNGGMETAGKESIVVSLEG